MSVSTGLTKNNLIPSSLFTNGIPLNLTQDFIQTVTNAPKSGIVATQNGNAVSIQSQYVIPIVGQFISQSVQTVTGVVTPINGFVSNGTNDPNYLTVDNEDDSYIIIIQPGKYLVNYNATFQILGADNSNIFTGTMSLVLDGVLVPNSVITFSSQLEPDIWKTVSNNFVIDVTANQRLSIQVQKLSSNNALCALYTDDYITESTRLNIQACAFNFT